jgi:hypothetical protein
MWLRGFHVFANVIANQNGMYCTAKQIIMPVAAASNSCLCSRSAADNL